MDIAIRLLTFALVGITGYYAWQNHLMVAEMKAARSIGLLPKLVPSMTYVSPDVSFPRVSNFGPGPALDGRKALARRVYVLHGLLSSGLAVMPS